MQLLTDKINFPPVESADENGFLAVGGDLSKERLLEAYRNGIFPWYNEDDPICWWSPDPRFVLFPRNLYISKSMRKIIQDKKFSFTTNRAFEHVIRACSTVKRKDGNGTWIHEDMIVAYTQLYRVGYAYSAEAWYNDKLAGGLYGVKIGNLFFGESMFSIIPNASKFAFIKMVQQLETDGIKLVDCQMYTKHLESLGACMISRSEFLKLLELYI